MSKLYQFPWRDGALQPADKDSGYVVLAESAEQARRILADHRGGLDPNGVPAPETVGPVFYYEKENPD